MKKRVTVIACALVLGASAASVSQGAALRSPGSGNHAAPAARFNAFANLGREGGGLAVHKNHKRKVEPAPNAWANLGHEGSGLERAWNAAAVRPWAN